MRLLLIIMLVSIFFGCKSGENKQVAKKDSVVHNFRMFVDTSKSNFFIHYTLVIIQTYDTQNNPCKGVPDTLPCLMADGSEMRKYNMFPNGQTLDTIYKNTIIYRK
jgi:hypothetical protein